MQFFVAFLVAFGGQSCMTIGLASHYTTEITAENIISWALHLGMYFHICLVWTIPPFIVQVLLKYLNKETMKKDEDLVQKCKKCVILFEGLSLSFSSFFVLYFTLIQIYSIFMTFNFIREALKHTCF